MFIMHTPGQQIKYHGYVKDPGRRATLQKYHAGQNEQMHIQITERTR
jgi:hypothetical protein